MPIVTLGEIKLRMGRNAEKRKLGITPSRCFVRQAIDTSGHCKIRASQADSHKSRTREN